MSELMWTQSHETTPCLRLLTSIPLSWEEVVSSSKNWLRYFTYVPLASRIQRWKENCNFIVDSILMPAVVAVSLLCLFIACIPFISCGKINEETNDKNVTIRPWQYCEGCKITSDMYSRAVNDHILLLKKSRKSKTVDAMGLLDHFCDRDEFSEYRSFIKMSCIKILDEFRVTFLESFQGNATETSMTNKKELYTRKKTCKLSLYWYGTTMNQLVSIAWSSQ